MTTVAEYIEFLKQFPPETEVEVLASKPNGSWYGGENTYFTEACIEEMKYGSNKNHEFINAFPFEGNEFVKPEAPHFGKKILLIGEKE